MKPSEKYDGILAQSEFVGDTAQKLLRQCWADDSVIYGHLSTAIERISLFTIKQ